MNLKNEEPCPVCGRFNNRGLTVDTIILKNNLVLLIKRGAEPFKDFWALPGGFVEWNETVENAVKRETKEEVGVDVTNMELIGVYSNPNRHPKQCITLTYRVFIEGEPKPGDDAKEIKWQSIDNVSDELAFDHKKVIEEYLEKK